MVLNLELLFQLLISRFGINKMRRLKISFGRQDLSLI
jgi:hypothetical protein